MTDRPLRIGVTMRGANAIGYDEPRDAIATDWAGFLSRALPDAMWMCVPNLGDGVRDYVRQWGLNAFILTGGDDLGATPRRDLTERTILDCAAAARQPVLGICRGLQLMAVWAGGALSPTERELHVATRHTLSRSADNDSLAQALPAEFEVNSYHTFAISPADLPPDMACLATTRYGLVEAARHRTLPFLGVMWHPEREAQPARHDIDIVNRLFGSSA